MSDLIDRQAAIEAFNTGLNELVVAGEENSKTVENYLNRVIEKIKCLPPAQLGTNLAEVGTDCISREKAIDAINSYFGFNIEEEYGSAVQEVINSLPSAESRPLKPWEVLAAQAVLSQPKIIYCKDCKYAEYIDDVKTLWCTECGQGRTVAPYDFCSYGERREDG